MKIKSMHNVKVKIPRQGKDPILFFPGEEKEVPDEIGKKMLESKGFMVPEKKEVPVVSQKLSKEAFLKLGRKEQEKLLTDKNIAFTSKDKEIDLYKKYSEVN